MVQASEILSIIIANNTIPIPAANPLPVSDLANPLNTSKPNPFPPIKGVVKFLEWAKSKQILMAVCTNKQERLAVDLLKKINLSQYFEYIAGCDTFDFNKPDPRHLTNVIDIIGGDINKSIMIGDSEVDSQSAYNAKIPFILVEEGYTEKNINEIPHKTLIKDFSNFEKIVEKYL